MEEKGGTLRAPYVNGDIMRAYFGKRRRIEGAEVLERIVRERSAGRGTCGRQFGE